MTMMVHRPVGKRRVIAAAESVVNLHRCRRRHAPVTIGRMPFIGRVTTMTTSGGIVLVAMA